MRKNKYSVECADKSSVIRSRHCGGGKHLKNKPGRVCFFPCCPTDILHYSIQNTIFLMLTFFFFCMLMFNKSPWLSVGTIIRYPQREIEKLIILSVLYFSDPLEIALRAVASPLSPSKHNQSAARDVACATDTIASIQ